jgi:hypothetical protein
MPKKAQKKPHVYKVGQRAEYQLALTGKVQSVVPKGKGVVVITFFPIKVANFKKHQKQRCSRADKVAA